LVLEISCGQQTKPATGKAAAPGDGATVLGKGCVFVKNEIAAAEIAGLSNMIGTKTARSDSFAGYQPWRNSGISGR